MFKILLESNRDWLMFVTAQNINGADICWDRDPPNVFPCVMVLHLMDNETAVWTFVTSSDFVVDNG